MVIADCLTWAVSQLRGAGDDTALLDARMLLCHVLGCDVLYLSVHRDEQVDRDRRAAFEEMVRRRMTGEPAAYIVRHKEFMSLDFYVDERVLIPRPDTEHLVQYALEVCSELKNPRVLDLCTGSGALAVSIAHYAPNAQVFAADISEGALEITEKNAVKNGTKIGIFRLDVRTELPSLQEEFDLIVSNPPYIERDIIGTLDADVRLFEPHLALDGGTDGLDFYRVMARECPRMLSGGGALAFEVGAGQADAVKELMEAAFCDVRIRKDYAGIERVVHGKKN